MSEYKILLILPLAMLAGACAMLPSERSPVTLDDDDRAVEFSGYSWYVKAKPHKAGPGPNYFSDRRENVWVDKDGRLHMRITRKDGRWRCAEVVCTQSLGYGKYTFYIDSYVDRLDPSVVLGLFTWDKDSEFAHREIDIEFSRWGKPEKANAQYVVQNDERPHRKQTFDLRLKSPESVHSFNWTKRLLAYESFRGHDQKKNLITSWKYDRDGVPRIGNESPRINLWLFRGKPPTNEKEVEVVISRFDFIPSR